MKSNIRGAVILIVLCTLPLYVEKPQNDSTETRIKLIGATGQYALISRGCEGNVTEKHRVPFSEMGVSIDHKFSSPVRLGVRGSKVFDKELIEKWHYEPMRGYETSTRLVSKEMIALNPFMNFEWKRFAIGGGYFWENHPLSSPDQVTSGKIKYPFSGYLRLGDPRSTYFSMHFLSEIPLYTGGYGQVGIGSGKNPDLNWWLGMGVIGPYDQGQNGVFKANILAKTDIFLQRHFYLNVILRLGETESISESAIGLGLTYQKNGRK